MSDTDDAVAELAQYGILTEPIRVNEHTVRLYTFFADLDGVPFELCER